MSTPSDRPPPAAPAPPWGPADVPHLAVRFGALLIDWVLCLFAGNIVGDPTRDGWPLLILILEYGIFIGLFAQTPGMALTRLRCVSFADGGRVGIPRALLRGLLLCLVVPALFMDPLRRGLHDRAAGSIVVVTTRR